MDIIDELYEIERKRNKSNKSNKSNNKKSFRVLTGKFCGLSRQKKWQEWLSEHAPDLSKKLSKHLETPSGCRANFVIMNEIYSELINRNLLEVLVKFLLEEYPNMVEEV